MSIHYRMVAAALGTVLLTAAVCDANWGASEVVGPSFSQAPPGTARPAPAESYPSTSYRRLPPVDRIVQTAEPFAVPSAEVIPLPSVEPLFESATGPLIPSAGEVGFESPSYEPNDWLRLASHCAEAPPVPSNTSYRLRGGPTRFRLLFSSMGYGIRGDYRNYYSLSTLRDLSVAVALAAPFANSSLDADFGNWYQRDFRTQGTDDFAAFWKTFGEGQIFIPAFAGMWLVGGMLDGWQAMDVMGTFGGRVTRAYLVGGPPMLFMQFCLGGGRPDEHAVGSQWQPFQDSNAVSGHAFMGAVPFITAAKMSHNFWAKSALYLCSTLAGWSRVNDNDHYATQACLGWWMAYLACRTVDETDSRRRCFEVMPLVTPEMSGVGVMYRR